MPSTLFSDSSACLADDCLLWGLYLQRKLFPKQHWFREASRRSQLSGEPAPLLGLLNVAFIENEAAETYSRLEKSNQEHWKIPPTPKPPQLLRKRRLVDFIACGIDARGKKAGTGICTIRWCSFNF